MQKKAISIGSIVLVLAAFSAFSRWIQNQAAFELETGLMKPGNPWSGITFVMVVLCMLGICWVVRNLWYEGHYAPVELKQIIHGNPLWLGRFTKSIAAVRVVGAAIAFLVAGFEL